MARPSVNSLQPADEGAARAFGLAAIFGVENSLDDTDVGVAVPEPTGDHLVVPARSPGGIRRLATMQGEAHLARGEKGAPYFTVGTWRRTNDASRLKA
jgi:hypothetical protein